MTKITRCILSMLPRFEIAGNYVKKYHFLSNTGRVYLRQAWLDK